MTFSLGSIKLFFVALFEQAKNPDAYKGGDKLSADSITRWAVRDNGKIIVSTTADAFPVNDRTTERVEVVNLGTDKDGNSFYFATVQDSGLGLPDDQAEIEAKCFALVLPEPGAHFGTSAHADDSFPTCGLLYKLDRDGKLVQQTVMPDVERMFVAGTIDDELAVAIETADRMAILDAEVFLDRVKTGNKIVADSEGKAKMNGEKLTRPELMPGELVMAVQCKGQLTRYDQEAVIIDQEDTGNVIQFPAVTSAGRQDSTSRITLERTGTDAGRILREPQAASAK